MCKFLVTVHTLLWLIGSLERIRAIVHVRVLHIDDLVRVLAKDFERSQVRSCFLGLLARGDVSGFDWGYI